MRKIKKPPPPARVCSPPPPLRCPAVGGISTAPINADLICWSFWRDISLRVDRFSLQVGNESVSPPRAGRSCGHFDTEPGGIRARRRDRGRTELRGGTITRRRNLGGGCTAFGFDFRRAFLVLEPGR